MEYDTIKNIVRNSKGNDFLVIINGKKIHKRLLINRNGYICEFKKRSFNKYTILDEYEFSQWEDVISFDYTKKFIDIMTKTVLYLNQSGMWVNLKNECEKILSLGYDTIDEILNIELSFDWDNKNDRRKKILSDNGIENCSFYSFIQLVEKGIKNVTFNKNEKETHINAIKYAFSTKSNFDCDWYKVHKNQVSIFTNCGGEFVGHLFELKSYGHYNDYYLLDATHALYKESV